MQKRTVPIGKQDVYIFFLQTIHEMSFPMFYLTLRLEGLQVSNKMTSVNFAFDTGKTHSVT